MAISKCPCCGGETFARKTHLPNKEGCEKYYIMCRNCGLETAMHETLQKAVEAWNRRI